MAGHRPLLYVRPRSDRTHDQPGRCSVCGADTTFAFNSWAVPGDMKAEWETESLGRCLVERETMYCRRCFANLRVRRVADVLLVHYAVSARTASELVDEGRFRELDLAEINSAGALHAVLERHPHLRYSEFREGAEPGDVVDGVRSEDVSRLTYSDATFDLVLTADTLEHVLDYRLALGEIRRVLRQGGRHIFTVPAAPTRRETVARVVVGEGGELAFSAPPQYHGRGSGPLALASSSRSDFLAYHDFGMDLLDALREAGFAPEVHFYRESDPGSDAALVFCAEAV
jgi:SAM-dependent methyltransferase